MIVPLLVGTALVAGLAGIAVSFLRQQFEHHFEVLELATRERTRSTGPRADLPPEVQALAARLGVRSDRAAGFAVFEQVGQMWRTPGGKPMNFTARQTVSVGATEFVWHATMGRAPRIFVADYLVGGIGGLEVKLAGAISLVRNVGGTAVTQGEVLRYLAELPWNADAMLANRALDWTVVNARTIKVAAGQGTERGEVTFELDQQGLVARVSAPSRTATEKGGNITRPWRGRFWDYQSIGGRFMPGQGEVAWVLAAGEFVYWRGRILNWSSPLATVSPDPFRR